MLLSEVSAAASCRSREVYGIQDYDYADVTLDRQGGLRCSLVKVAPLEAGAAPNQQPLDPRVWYEFQGRRLPGDQNPGILHIGGQPFLLQHLCQPGPVHLLRESGKGVFLDLSAICLSPGPLGMDFS